MEAQAPSDGDPPSRSTRSTRRRFTGIKIPATVRVALIRESAPPYPQPIRSARDVFQLLGEIACTWDREHFLTVILDGKGRCIGVDQVSVGSLTAALVHPREVLKAVILANGASFIAVHGHPSGDPTPSPEDLALTIRLKSAGELMGIRLLDHVVLGHERYYSLADAGQL